MAEPNTTEVVHTPSAEVKAYRPGIRGILKRVENFVGITEKVSNAVEKVPQTNVDKVSGVGFWERLGASMDRGWANLKERTANAIPAMKEKLAKTKEYFDKKAEEVQQRRAKLGIVDTVKSYIKDGVDAVRSGVDVVEARWKTATIDQLIGERAKLRESYEEAKKMKAAGQEVPEGYIASRSKLREALKPIHVAEFAARTERRKLRQEAKVLRSGIEKKQNVRALLEKAKSKNTFGVTSAAMAAA
jgi:hypothetical protein